MHRKIFYSLHAICSTHSSKVVFAEFQGIIIAMAVSDSHWYLKPLCDQVCGRYCRYSRCKLFYSDNYFNHVFLVGKLIAQFTFVENLQIKIKVICF